MANHSKPVIAAFDFDKTLTHRDSLLPFLHYAVGTATTFINIFFEIPHVIQFLFGRLDRQGLKEAFLTRFLKGTDQREMHHIAEQFSRQVLPKLVRPEGLERLAWHKSQGHRCILISANLDLYLNPWGHAAGFDHIIASRVEFSPEGKITGRLTGLNCRGPEKVRRLAEQVGEREEYVLYAYGDSEGDRELLDFADFPFYRRLL